MSQPERAPSPTARSGRERARAYRERMRAKGLRQVTVWAIDTRSPEFAAAAARAVAMSDAETNSADDLAFWESVEADWGPWDDGSRD